MKLLMPIGVLGWRELTSAMMSGSSLRTTGRSSQKLPDRSWRNRSSKEVQKSLSSLRMMPSALDGLAME